MAREYKNEVDIIETMLNSLAYELIAAYRDYFYHNDYNDFLGYIENIYDQVRYDQEEMEEGD